ncbi:MAG: lysylphosphatidylglycerol synthase transmembrane domain-containing protein [Candidatus Promineifilaceae bacterium]|nr:lysylphosphatidylglycerol synthase transmembrane domain-containing protein [Candidatus Promineifilaceae bacterium]
MKRWRLWLGLLISALFLWLALRGLNLDEVGASLREANYGWLVPAGLAYFLTVGARSWRWTFLLRPVQAVPSRRLFPVVVIGYLGNNIYPFRIGELLRAYLLRRREGISAGAGLATIFIERIFDGLTILTFVFLALPLAPLPGEGIRSLLLASSALFFGALLFFLALAARPQITLRLLDFFLRFLRPGWRPPVLALGRRFLSGLASLRDWRTLLLLFLISVAIWLLETAKYWLVMQAFPFALDFIALLFMNGVVNLATILPSAPGYVGTFDAPGIAVLVLYDVPEALAGAYVLTLHATLWLPSTLVGLIFMVRAGLSWSDLGRAAKIETTPPDGR